MFFKQYLAEFVRQEAIAPLLPQRPLVSSSQAGWESIYLEHHRQPAYETPEFRYPIHIVSIHLRGATTVERWSERTQRQRCVVTSGDITIYPANTRHWERSDRTAEFIDLHLDPSLVMDSSGSGAIPSGHESLPEILPQFAIRDPLIQQIGLSLHSELQISADPLYAEALAQALAVHLLRRYAHRPPALPPVTGSLSPYQLNQVIDYIEAHLEQNLRVGAIAQQVQLSPYHFSRRFRQSTGLAPHQYILQRRVERAQQLLKQGGAIAEVSNQVGFSSQSQLTRHCKKLLGATPRQLQHQSASYLNGHDPERS